jgi:hypothetical protein
MADPLLGGLRDRVIEESLHRMLKGALTQLGWLTHRDDRLDVTYEPEPLEADEVIVPNLVNAVIEGIDPEEEQELGSTLSDDTHLLYVDVYAESEAVGKQLAGDIRCILEGKMPSIGRTWPVLKVYDYTGVDYSMATPNAAPELFDVVIERVRQDKAHRAGEAWQRYLYSVTAELHDDRD